MLGSLARVDGAGGGGRLVMGRAAETLGIAERFVLGTTGRLGTTCAGAMLGSLLRLGGGGG